MRRTPPVEEMVLPPGRYFIGGGRCRMRTTLGAGVVITRWDRAMHSGAMMHFEPVLNGDAIPLELNGLAGPDGLQLVMQSLQWSQIDPTRCIARICGGGTVASRTDRVPSLNSGQAAGEFARRMLRACGLPIVSESFYAVGRHQIIFDVETGRVHARRIKPVVVALDARLQPAAPHAARRIRPRARALEQV
jgi:chemotaxis protein CheD